MNAPEFVLTTDQEAAWSQIQAWLLTKDSVFVLKGYAGTGKSMMLKKLLTLDHDFVFTAPTNKAAKVLSKFLDRPTKTVYSLLGLRMEQIEDRMELIQAEMPQIDSSLTNPIIVIDEASMVPRLLADLMLDQCSTFGWRVIYVGDPAQLNPVGEDRSPVWSQAHAANRVHLSKVVRYDSELLDLSKIIRAKIRDKDFDRSPIKDHNSNDQGVFCTSRLNFLASINKLKLGDWIDTKVVAWRNRTVDEYNSLIRKNLGFESQYEKGDLIMLAAPIYKQVSKRSQVAVAHVDDEFVVEQVNTQIVTLPTGDQLAAYRINLVDSPITLLVPQSDSKLSSILSDCAAAASQASKDRKKLWSIFWEIKNTFNPIRYGYALTAHRVQGTTLKSVFVDQWDILSNSNKLEAFRCLYVACTRAENKIVTYA